jgi:hypothetical protein
LANVAAPPGRPHPFTAEPGDIEFVAVDQSRASSPTRLMTGQCGELKAHRYPTGAPEIIVETKR